MNKICSKCKKEKPLDQFYKRKNRPWGSSECKDCFSNRRKEKWENDKKYRRKLKQYSALYKKEHYEELKEQRKEYHQSKLYKDHRNSRRKTDINYRLLCNARTRVYKILKGHNAKKICRTIDLLGCSIEFFKAYIESKFLIGMSWDNYNFNGWHLDHIIPCACFDLTKIEEQKKCFHYTNLQPLWADDNISKNSWYGGKLNRVLH